MGKKNVKIFIDILYNNFLKEFGVILYNEKFKYCNLLCLEFW